MHEGVKGIGVACRTRGVTDGNECLAARGGFILVAVGVDGPGTGAISGMTCGGMVLAVTGVDGPGAGVTPEAVHFFPVVGTGRGPSKGLSNTALMPKDRADDMKKGMLRFLTAVAISSF